MEAQGHGRGRRSSATPAPGVVVKEEHEEECESGSCNKDGTGRNQLPLDICLPQQPGTVVLKPLLLSKNRERRNEMNRNQKRDILRPGMVHLKGYLSITEQANIVKMCRELGMGDGGFYQPGYRDGAKLDLKMMCLGKHWDPETCHYSEKRPFDGAHPPPIPPSFHDLIRKAIEDSHALIQQHSKTTSDPTTVLPFISSDVCIVNFYSENGRLGLHQDKGESQESLCGGMPVVSFSIGDSAVFLFGDDRDVDKAQQVVLESGDVLIFGGNSRNVFHGVSGIRPGTAPNSLLQQTNLRPGRLNLTFRQVTPIQMGAQKEKIERLIQMGTQKEKIERLEARSNSLDEKFHMLEAKMDTRFEEILAAINGSSDKKKQTAGSSKHQVLPRYIRMEFPKYGGAEPTEWLHHVQQFFHYQGTSKDQQVALASFHMEGEANQWFQWLQRSYQEENRPITWEDFEHELLARFGPTDFEDYDEALMRIKQMGSLQEYLTEFERLANRVSEWPQKALVGAFVGGLKPDLAGEVRMWKPKHLREAMEYARMKNDQITHKPKVVRSTEWHMANVGGEHVSQPLLKKLTWGDMKRKREKGLCLSCDERYTIKHKCKKPQILMIGSCEDDDDRLANGED